MDDKETYSMKGKFPLFLLLCTFKHSLHNQIVTMFVDNMGMVQCINSGKSKDPAIMCLIIALYYYTSIYHVNYKFVHLYSVDNGSADVLSRLQLRRFQALNPLADQLITPPGECIIDFNIFPYRFEPHSPEVNVRWPETKYKTNILIYSMQLYFIL